MDTSALYADFGSESEDENFNPTQQQNGHNTQDGEDEELNGAHDEDDEEEEDEEDEEVSVCLQ